MTPITTLSYRGRPVRLRGAMLNLTDMWRAAGRPEHRRPAKWLSFDETARFRAHAHEHWAETDDPEPDAEQEGDNVLPEEIIRLEPDGFVAALRGRRGGTWAHWQLALPYARYLSPAFHLWCNAAVRAAMAQRDGPPAALDRDPLALHLAAQFRLLHRRLDTLERHAADLMFLVLSTQDLLLDRRRDFSERSRAAIAAVAAAEPFDGRCPCCGQEPVVTDGGRPLPGAEFDHVFHRGLNKPEHGWLVCRACHGELTHGGYLVRFLRLPEFRAFQAAVLERRRRERTDFRAQAT